MNKPSISAAAGLWFLFIVPVAVWAESGAVIHRRAVQAFADFAIESPAADKLLEQAAGVLIFPDIVEMGFGEGGEFGEGVLLIDDQPRDYYVSAGTSGGRRLGVQFKAHIIAFMTPEALRQFQNSRGWQVGVDGRIALVKVGAAGSPDADTAQQPVVGFVFSNLGLMYNLTLAGTKIIKLAK